MHYYRNTIDKSELSDFIREAHELGLHPHINERAYGYRVSVLCTPEDFTHLYETFPKNGEVKA